MAGAALEIADAIKRLQHFFAELRSLGQNSLPHIGGGVAKAGKIVIAVDLEHVVEEKADVFQGGFVDRHGFLSACSAGTFTGDFAAQQSLSSRMDLRRFQKPKAGQGSRCDNLTATIGCRRNRDPVNWVPTASFR